MMRRSPILIVLIAAWQMALAQPPPRLSLGPYSPPQAAANKSGALAIGMHRPLPANVLKSGKWSGLPGGGRVWRLQLQSNGAVALRLHFEKFEAGKGKVWVYEGPSRDAGVKGPYTGSGIDEKGDFWSDTVYGDSVTIEFQPDGKAPKLPPFLIREISHQVR